jgi:TetR/AcrR family transcriptional regulator, transcriptional repressor for nem operon
LFGSALCTAQLQVNVLVHACLLVRLRIREQGSDRAFELWTERSYILCMSIGRPLQFEPDEALRAATGVFWARGFGATSLQDLLDATGLSKSSLYQTFGNKQALFDRCVHAYCCERAAQMRKALSEARSGWAFIEGTFFAAAEGRDGPAAQWGCLLMNTAAEFGRKDPAVGAMVRVGLDRFAEVFREAVERAQREGAVGAERDAQALADYLVSSMSGLRTLVKAGIERRRAMEIARGIIAGAR